MSIGLELEMSKVKQGCPGGEHSPDYKGALDRVVLFLGICIRGRGIRTFIFAPTILWLRDMPL